MIETFTEEYLTKRPKTIKKELGQYFTNHKIASYMAEMIKRVNVPVIRILDAGAGTGILTIFSAIRSLKLGQKRIHAVLYEIDKDLYLNLTENMKYLTHIFKKQGGKFTFKIYNKDFVLDRPDKSNMDFHISSINPPYFKNNSPI